MAWTDEEITAYQQINSLILDNYYSEACISKNNPEERAKYLAENILNLNMTDHDIIMRTAAKTGKPKALNLLEELVIKNVRSSLKL